MVQLASIDMTDAQELGEGFKAIPPGEYQMYIESSDVEPTKAKKEGKSNNEYLKLTAVVCDGDYEGSKVIVRLNLWNDNQQAVDISKSHLRALCEAILGQPFVNDSSMLHSRPFFAYVDNVAINKDDPNSKRSNEILFRKGNIRSLNSGPPAQVVTAVAAYPVNQAVAAQQAAPAVKPGTGKPPWKK